MASSYPLLYSFIPPKGKAGTQGPKGVYQAALDKWANVPDWLVPDEIKDEAENAWLLNIFIERDADSTVPEWTLTPMRQMAQTDGDIIPVYKDKRLNMKFDWKRELIDPDEVLALPRKSGPPL